MKPTKNSLDIEEPIDQINTKEQNAPVLQTQTQNTSLETKFDTPSSNLLSEPIQQATNTFNVSGMTIDALNLLQVSLEYQKSCNLFVAGVWYFPASGPYIPAIESSLARLTIDEKYFSSKRNFKILFPSQMTQVYRDFSNLILCQDHNSNQENRQTRELLRLVCGKITCLAE